MEQYDIIIAGGGAAGLSLAHYLSRSPWRERSILIIDKDNKRKNDRTWCFWTMQPGLYREIIYRQWPHLRFVSEGFEAVFNLYPYQYYMIRGIDFYEYSRERLSRFPNITFHQGEISRIESEENRAVVTVDGAQAAGSWLFDSTFQAEDFGQQGDRYHYLMQHFLGWEIETETAVFHPDIPTLFDFRTPQKGSTRFFYILPFSERRALVEYTLFSPSLLEEEAYISALETYLADVMGLTDYRVLEKEQGIIPMTDQPFPRQAGKRIMNIGTKGGVVKASSGYAFLRIQQDSQAIVRSLVRHGHPFAVPASPYRYRQYDSIMLQVMSRRGDMMKQIFTALFRNNPVQTVFRFLDEEASLSENLPLLASLPRWPFLEATFRLKLLGKV